MHGPTLRPAQCRDPQHTWPTKQLQQELAPACTTTIQSQQQPSQPQQQQQQQPRRSNTQQQHRRGPLSYQQQRPQHHHQQQQWQRPHHRSQHCPLCGRSARHPSLVQQVGHAHVHSAAAVRLAGSAASVCCFEAAVGDCSQPQRSTLLPAALCPVAPAPSSPKRPCAPPPHPTPS
jgi:hypothetical protein